MSPYDVIQAPLLSEKAYQGMATGRYTFWVQPSANKSLIKHAVQEAFKVKVVGVNIVNVRGKFKRVGRFSGFKADRKKAIVQLADGQKIDALEGLV
jgi:large subunit ribosomal protein L23